MSAERGFTLIEVLAAMLVLLVGVLGTVGLIDGANATTSFTKGREGGTNLARELIEMSRSVDYDKVTAGALPGQLQSKPGLGDADTATAGWQITRRGVDYTIVTSACTFDDGTDKAGSHDGSFCSNSATTPTGDSNPDDYRRVTFDVTWTDRNRSGKVSETGLITNPSGGLGPTISSFTQGGSNPITSGTSVPFSVTSSAADAVRWSADDGNSQGDASGGPTAWTFTWNIGTVGTFSCTSSPGWVLDGDYIVTAQAFDSRGVPGDLRTKTVTINRSSPAPPCGLTGGRNGSVVDLQWLANPERDIVGYKLYRVRVGSESSDPLICPLSANTTCVDSSPPDSSTYATIQYYVK
ncbi:MAG: prepilin-type N-terminal cleavage/methylation domain-containing protein, partial [Thermoleophilaceae bacterium]